jgi:carbon-monoxide dehydrogenase iron sulfur subunit
MLEKSEAPAGRMYVANDSAVCGGCRRCQLACSLFHYGECNLELASVHVTKDVFSGEYEVETCRQCEEPECLSACAIQAIYVDEKTGAIVIDEENCTGCRACEEECPFHMIGYDPDRNICFKCDLCGGDPQCVKNCPHTAVKLVER